MTASPRTVSTVAARLAAWPTPGRWVPPFARHAAVAVVFRDHPDGMQLLLTVRATRGDDPWSGHVAFPGGFAQPGDGDAVGTARREAHEEVGIALGAPLGLGAAQRAWSPRGRRPLVIVPVVFSVSDDPPLVCEAGEVQRALWTPWAHVTDPDTRVRRTWRLGPVPLPMPGVPVDGEILWGLSLRIVDDLAAQLG